MRTRPKASDLPKTGDPLALILVVWLAINSGNGQRFRRNTKLAIKPEALASLTHYFLTGHFDTTR